MQLQPAVPLKLRFSTPLIRLAFQALRTYAASRKTITLPYLRPFFKGGPCRPGVSPLQLGRDGRNEICLLPVSSNPGSLEAAWISAVFVIAFDMKLWIV